MIVTILRHGEAGPAAADRERRLTSRGVTDIERAAPVLVAACRSRALALPQRVLHSPWERTRATAQIVAQHLQVEARPLDALAPGATSLQVDEALALHAVDQPGDVGDAMQHALAQVAAALAFRVAGDQQPEQVELGQGQPMGGEQAPRLVHHGVSG